MPSPPPGQLQPGPVSSGRGEDGDGVPEKGFVSVQLAQELCQRTPQMNLHYTRVVALNLAQALDGKSLFINCLPSLLH